MVDDLRPIGTEYWTDWIWYEYSTDPREFMLKYRVVAHVDVIWYGKVTTAEKVEPVDIRYRMHEEIFV